MKKIIIIFAILLACSLSGIYAMNHPKIHQLVKSNIVTKPEEKLLFDWLNYLNFVFNQHQPQQEKIFDKELGSDEMLLAIVNNTPKIIESNIINSKTLEKIEFKTDEFKEIQKLDIESLRIQNQLMQENVVDYYAKHKKTQSYLQAPVLNLQAKSAYLLQQIEIKNLNYLQILKIKKDLRLKNIDADELEDWILYQKFTHESDPKDPNWDTMKILKEMGNRSSSDDQLLLKNYQNQKFKNDRYQKIQQLNILAIQSNLNLFSDFSKPQNIQQASEQLKKLNQLLKTNDFNNAVEISNKIEELTQKAHQEMILSLEKHFL